MRVYHYDDNGKYLASSLEEGPFPRNCTRIAPPGPDYYWYKGAWFPLNRHKSDLDKLKEKAFRALARQEEVALGHWGVDRKLNIYKFMEFAAGLLYARDPERVVEFYRIEAEYRGEPPEAFAEAQVNKFNALFDMCIEIKVTVERLQRMIEEAETTDRVERLLERIPRDLGKIRRSSNAS